MRKGIKASLLFLLVMTAIGKAAAQSPSPQPKASAMEANVTKVKQAMLGNWESIAPEVRPSAAKNADGSLKPFYLKRAFKYLPSDRFDLELVYLRGDLLFWGARNIDGRGFDTEQNRPTNLQIPLIRK